MHQNNGCIFSIIPTGVRIQMQERNNFSKYTNNKK